MNTTSHARAGEQSMTFQREFDAPIEHVFRAHTEPELFAQWVGPRGTTVRIDRFDATTGGGFRYAVVAGNNEWAFFGAYHEVAAPNRIVHTWEFAEDLGHPTLEILTFVDLGDGRTRLDGHSLYGTKAETDQMESSDMNTGMDENFDRLDDLLPTLR